MKIEEMMGNKIAKNAALGLLLATATTAAMAGGGDGAFIQGLLTFLTDSLTGAVGKVIGIAGILYGLVAGIKNGSLAGFGVGVGLAVGAYYGPDIIDAMAPATLALGMV